jgi:hypothetical protein
MRGQRVKRTASNQLVDERAAGATLDLASGGLTVTTSSSATFVVVQASGATEETLVAFNGSHYLNP